MPPPAEPLPESQWAGGYYPPAATWTQLSYPASYDDMRRGYATAKTLLGDVYAKLATLGERVRDVGTAADADTLARLDDSSALIDPLAAAYDAYIALYNRLNRAAGEFMANEWYHREDHHSVVMKVQGLPITVGALSPSRDRMEEIAQSLAQFGEGAAVAVDTANKVVLYAETAHKVLTAVQMVGGVGALVQTGATMLTQATLKECAKQGAIAAMKWTASAAAASAANYALNLLPLTDEQRHWLKVGLDAYQIFAFYKAAKVRVQPGSSCFVAGTRVATGVNADGSLVTKAIEDIQEGELVLSRDQYNVGDDLDPRHVTRVFRRTSDHLRVLTIQGDGANVEAIHTTDEHPFYVERRGWTAAGQLLPGDHVQETDGTWQTIVTTARQAHPEGVTVYNLEVDGDHTYFVEDGGGQGDAVWVHNNCVNGTFYGDVGGHPIPFKNVPVKSKKFIVRSRAESDALQAAASGPKSNYLKDLANDPVSVSKLKQSGVPDAEILRMSAGKSPAGYQVHHKHPVKLGGDNNQENFILMQSHPKKPNYHSAFTNAQNRLTNGVAPGTVIEAEFPEFSGIIYPP